MPAPVLVLAQYAHTDTLMQSKGAIIPSKHHLLPLSQWGACSECHDHQYAALLSQHKLCRTSPILWSFLGLRCSSKSRVHVFLDEFVCLPSGSDSMMYGGAAACYQREQVALSRDKLTTHCPDLMCRRKKEDGTIVFILVVKISSCYSHEGRRMTEAHNMMEACSGSVVHCK